FSMAVAFHDPAGEPSHMPTVRLGSVPLMFVDPAFTIAGDAAVPNGSVAGSATFNIRTDGGLTPYGTPCIIDANFEPPSTLFEGAIPGPSTTESNSSADITNPMVWPDDL